MVADVKIRIEMSPREENELQTHLSSFAAAPFLFIGAGLSRCYLGLDDWNGLLTNLANLTGRPYEYFVASANSDLPAVASKIAADLHERWWSDDAFAEHRSSFGKELHTRESALKAEVSSYIEDRSASRGALGLSSFGKSGWIMLLYRHPRCPSRGAFSG